MIASYYFWRWANNDLPGRPAEILPDLLAGWLPPSLAPFNARPLCVALGKLARRRRTEEWHWEVSAHDFGGDAAARCVFVTRATRSKRAPDTEPFWQAVGPLDLSGCEEGSARLIDELPPKLNDWKGGQVGIPLLDVARSELPGLLRTIDPAKPNAYVTMGGRQTGHFVQCCLDPEANRFCVEWAANLHWPKWVWNQWRAQDPARLAALGGSYAGQDLPTDRDPDLLPYEDTLHLFEAFHQGDPRPTDRPWRCMNDQLGGGR